MANLKTRKGNTVLVGVLKSRRDLGILLQEHWYRIPIAYLPKRAFKYVAFYQPVIFGRRGKRIEYYARVKERKIAKRKDILPLEQNHPMADLDYLKISFKKIIKLERPIRNIIPRRISFGFTTLSQLKSSRDILALYGVPAIEKILAQRLRHLGIETTAEHTVSSVKKRVRIDLAVFCVRGIIAIECDNRGSHLSGIQKERDKKKDIFLKRLSFYIMRFPEEDIIEKLGMCAEKISHVVDGLGGLRR